MRIFLLILTLLFIHNTYSQDKRSPNRAELQKIGDNVYAIIHDDATDQWPHGNTGVIIGNDAVMVVDAAYLPSMAREDIRLIKTITKKPVKYLVFTHWHFDHNNGTVVYKDSFPGITIISERETQRFIELNATWWSRRAAAPGSSKRTELQELQARLANGKDTAGKEFSNSEKEKLSLVIAQRQNELNELIGLKVVAPNKVFDGSLTIDIGGRKVQLTDMGKANSPHDVIIYLPKEQILFTGDILVQAPLPYFGASWPVAWVKVLHKLQTIPIKTMVPGHGPVQSDHQYTQQVLQFLETAMQKVEAMIWQGKTIEEIQATINMDEFKKGAWSGSYPDFEAGWKYNLNAIVDRIWRGIRGQG